MYPIRQIDYSAIECSLRALFPEVQLSTSQMRKLIEVFKKIESCGEAQTSYISSQVQPQLSLVSSSSSSNTSKKRKYIKISEDVEEKGSKKSRIYAVASSSLQLPAYIPVQNDSENWVFPTPPNYPVMSNFNSIQCATFNILKRKKFSGNPKMKENEWRHIQSYLPEQLQNQIGRDILDTIIQLYLQKTFGCFEYNKNLSRLHPTTQQRLRNLVLVHASRFFPQFVGFFRSDHDERLSISFRYTSFKDNTPLFKGITKTQYERMKKMCSSNRLNLFPPKKYINAYIARALAWPYQKIQREFQVHKRGFNRHMKNTVNNQPTAFSVRIQAIHEVIEHDEKLSELLPSLSFHLL